MQPCMEFTHWHRGLRHTQGGAHNPSLAQEVRRQHSAVHSGSKALQLQLTTPAAAAVCCCCVRVFVVCGHRSRSGRPSTASAMLRSASMATHRCGQQKQQPSGQGRLQHTQHSSQCHTAQVWTVQPDDGLDLHARQECHGHMNAADVGRSAGEVLLSNQASCRPGSGGLL